MPDVAALIEEQTKAFEDFKKSNNARLTQIESKGTADPLLGEQVDKANADITRLSDEIASKTKAANNRMDELETIANRPNVGGEKNKDVQAKANEFFSLIQGKEVENGNVDEYVAYRKAFNSYMRKGDKAIRPDIQAALSVGSDPDGGYWVDPDTSGRIATLVYETSPMRQLADVQTIGTDSLEGFNDLAEAGLGGWVGETASRAGDTATPGIGKWSIPVHEQYAEPRATQKVLDDAQFNVESWLSGKVADKLGRTENTAFYTGDGVEKPRGILTYAAGTPSSTTWDVIEQVNSGAAGDFAATLPGDNLIDLVFSLKAAYRSGAVWNMARSTVAETRKLVDGQGNYLWQPEFTAQQGGLLLGYPIVEAEDMPVLAANSLSIAFGNFKTAYQIVDRQGIRILRDPYTTKGYVKFYTTKRVGGDVVNYEALKIMKFAV